MSQLIQVGRRLGRRTLTYSMRTRLHGRSLFLIALAARSNRWLERWSCWLAIAATDATADGLPTLGWPLILSSNRSRPSG